MCLTECKDTLSCLVFFSSYVGACARTDIAPISPIAVIPFENLSTQNEWPGMSQAIANAIVTKLSKVRGL